MGRDRSQYCLFNTCVNAADIRIYFCELEDECAGAPAAKRRKQTSCDTGSKLLANAEGAKVLLEEASTIEVAEQVCTKANIRLTCTFNRLVKVCAGLDLPVSRLAVLDMDKNVINRNISLARERGAIRIANEAARILQETV